MDEYTCTFVVVSKAQSTIDDGVTQFITVVESTSAELSGATTLTTTDPDTDAFFTQNGNYTATLVAD